MTSLTRPSAAFFAPGAPAAARAVLRLLAGLPFGALDVRLPDGTIARYGSAAGARDGANTMPLLLDAARAYATVGEMCDSLREVWGENVETPII